MEGNFFLYIWKKSRVYFIDGRGREIESLFYILVEIDVRGKCYFVDKENVFRMISLYGLVFIGYFIFR